MKLSALILLLITVYLNTGCHKAEDATEADLPLTMVDGYGAVLSGIFSVGQPNQR